MLSDAELEAIRQRDRSWPIDLDHEQHSVKDRRALLAEDDRLREGEKLAREWLAAFKEMQDRKDEIARAQEFQAMEVFRTWCEAQK